MGGQTTFGYEQSDGTVKYGVTFPALQFDEMRNEILRRVPVDNAPLTDIASSVEDYFSDERSNSEDTAWRVLYMLDGTTVCRSPLMPGDLVFIPKYKYRSKYLSTLNIAQ
jgi:predicted  nucleic acid-binding Zn ribbon protein